LTKNVTNLAASVRQRLANLARQRNEDFGLLLTKYALERLLFRISQSEYQKIFVLKGALLFELWTEQAHRPTRDADFLSNGDNDPSRFESIFKEICAPSMKTVYSLTRRASRRSASRKMRTMKGSVSPF
jgi:hypothetical protein